MAALRDGTVLLAYGRHTGPNDPGYARLRDEHVARYGGGLAIERDNDFGEIVAVRLDAQGRRLTDKRVLVPAPPDGLSSMSTALRQSDHPEVIKGRMSACLMRVPLAWFSS